MRAGRVRETEVSQTASNEEKNHNMLNLSILLSSEA